MQLSCFEYAVMIMDVTARVHHARDRAASDVWHAQHVDLKRACPRLAERPDN